MILSRAVFAVGAAVFVYGFALGDGNFFALLWAVAILLVNLAVIWAGMRPLYHAFITGRASIKKRNAAILQCRFPSPDEALLAGLGCTPAIDRAGQASKTLYYIVSGSATVSKSDKEIEVGDNLPIGEISFSQDVPATATVHAHEGSVLVSWPSKKLKRLLKRKNLKAGFDALLSNDLAEKLAKDEARSASDD